MCGNITYNVNLTEQESSQPGTRRETALLAAAKSGIEETVDAILDRFLKAIEDEDNQKKNLVLQAMENRHSLHLASPYDQDRHWLLPGPALQMKWEVLWHQALEGEFAFSVFAISSLAALCTSMHAYLFWLGLLLQTEEQARECYVLDIRSDVLASDPVRDR
ncbi:hypothetical protein CDL15_Pgr024705 [Punica granatum]|uniref:Uncharacterized protein n=1 Tax=Punica granatum TaxID=22663 RepID=A0A218W5Q6_PUNGR|nr:hypothetical protein CDL15_Pgr024705 [Punica granatum]